MPRPDATSGSLRHGTPKGAAGPLQRLFIASIALVAGNTALLLFLLQNALRVRALLLRVRMGEPHLVLDQMWNSFRLYALFSVVGWLLVGVPTALAFPPRLLLRVRWPVRLVIGAAMGPLAYLLISVALFAFQGRLREFSLAHTEMVWPFSILVSTVSFLVYAALLSSRLMDR